MPANFTHMNLGDVDDAAPGNGFSEVWEARVARSARPVSPRVSRPSARPPV